MSGSSAFSKPSLYIWNFSIHVLLKPSQIDSKHYLTSRWNECNCVVVWTFFGTALLWVWNKNWPFQSCGHCCVFQVCWNIECNTFTAPSFRILNNSAGLLSPLLSLLAYAGDTTLRAESKEELKSLLMKMKEESEKAVLKLSIQKTKIMASSPITSWQIDRETMERVADRYCFLRPTWLHTPGCLALGEWPHHHGKFFFVQCFCVKNSHWSLEVILKGSGNDDQILKDLFCSAFVVYTD